jgi:predicted TIM-barrel fold metal-dependent hydrolase
MKSCALLFSALLGCCAAAAQAPAADHHQHVFSPAVTALLASPAVKELGARDVVALLDAAGIRRALLLSTAYMFGSPTRKVEDEYAKVRAENDWTAAQAAEYPDRLRAFCGFNPLRDYALEELARCAAHPGLRGGIKLHFGNSDVQLENPRHVERMRAVFRAANARRMAIVVHLRASISRKRPYAGEQARAFLEQLLPEAPDVPVQVAHMAGTGPAYEDPPAHAVIAVLAEAVERGDPRTRSLWFDVASVANPGNQPATSELLAKRIRQIGVDRIVYGTDSAAGDNLRPAAAWAAFRRLPLTQAEIARIASNLAPHLR